MSDLDKLFGDFDKRKQEEMAASEAKANKEKQLRAETTAILESVVRPTLQELSEAITAKGHRAEVRERFGNYTYPSVGLAFYPKTPEYGHTPESTIDFLHTVNGHIKIEQKIQSSDTSKKAASYSDYSTNGVWPLATVSQEKVRDRTLQFIEAVLKVN